MDCNRVAAASSDKLPLKFWTTRTSGHRVRSRNNIIFCILAVFILTVSSISSVSAVGKYNQVEVKSQTIQADEEDDEGDSDGKKSTDEKNKETIEAKDNKKTKAAPTAKRDKNEFETETEEEDDDKDEDIPLEPGQLSGFVNPELTHDWVDGNSADAKTQLSANLSSLINLQITSNLKLGVETSFEMEGGGQYFAFESPSLFLNTLTIAYAGEWGGIGAGKYNPLNEDNLVDPIWDRQLNLFDNFPSNDLDISDTIGLRTWFNLGSFLETDHYLNGGVFFRDDTPLGRSIFTQRTPLPSDVTGLAYTGKLNNWMISLHGDELPYAPDWEYAIGAVSQAPGLGDLNRELSIFSGVYGEFDLSDDIAVSPMAEVLYRDGADGKNQDVVSAVLSLSFEDGPWIYGSSYSHRHLIDHANNDDITDDNEAQLFTSYYFDSGAYIDFGYQFLSEDGEAQNAVSLAVGIPFEFTANLYGKEKAPKKGLERKSIKRIIRR
jgi:hypothetical protein